MPISLGAAKGLSFTEDWNKDIDRLYQREQYSTSLRRENEEKTRFYAGLMKKGHVNVPSEEAELQEYYLSVNDELADFSINNPNFELDPIAMGKYIEITDKYLNNPIIQRSLQVKEEFDMLRQAKSKEQLTEDEYNAEMARYTDYSENGGEPYSFTDFAVVDLNVLGSELISTLGTTETIKYNPRTGADDTTVSIPLESLYLAADSSYAVPKNKIAIDNQFKNYLVDDPAIAGIYSGPDAARKWWRARLSSMNEISKASSELTLANRAMLAGRTGDNTGSGLYALNDKVKALTHLANTTNDDGSFVEATDQAIIEDINLTAIGGSEEYIINASSGVLAYNNSTGGKDASGKEIQPGYEHVSIFRKQATTDNPIGEIDPSVAGMPFTPIGVGTWVTIGGIPYLEVSGYILNAQKNKGNQSNYDVDKLGNYGFSNEDWVSGTSIPSFGSTSTKKGLKHKGTLLFPMKVSGEGMANWTGDYLGVPAKKEVTDAYSQWDYTAMTSGDFDLYKIKIFSDLGVQIKDSKIDPATLKAYNLPDGSTIEGGGDRFYNSTVNDKGNYINGIWDMELNKFYIRPSK